MKSFDLGKGVVLGAAAASLLAPQVASAGGLFAGDSGSQAQSRAGAFVAKADDPTALMHNPAGLAEGTGWQIFLGANLVGFTQTFDRDGSYHHWVDGPPSEPDAALEGQDMPKVENSGSVQPVPFIAATGHFGKLAVGLGLFAPQGYPNRDYPETVLVNGVVAPAPQRYDMIKQETLAALPSVALAYRVLPNLDLGVRFSSGFGTLKAKTYLWGLPNQVEDREVDATFELDVKDNFVPAWGAGALLRLTDRVHIGASYSSEVSLGMSGEGSTVLGSRVGISGTPTVIGPLPDTDVACAKGGTHEKLKTCVDITIPQTATVGGRYILRDGKGAERGDIELDVRWENHQAAENIVVTVDAQVDNTGRALEKTVMRHGFKDVFSTRLGGSYSFPIGFGKLEARAGVSYDNEAAPQSWTRLDIDSSDRLQVAGGLALDGGSWKVDVGGAGIFSGDRTATGPDPFAPAAPQPPPQDGRTNPDAQNPQSGPENQDLHPINLGTYSSGYFIIATGVTFKF